MSLGAGNGDLETAMAARLDARGLSNLEIELLELNPVMLERAVAHAERLGVKDRITVQAVDLNSWEAAEPADAYLACHSLHHVVELEHLFDEVARTLRDDGVLLVNDMVGRDGHRRWPEAAGIVLGLWRTLAPSQRLNNYTGVEDPRYPDHDCSSEGFEGVRAQDVLPLLLERFHPDVYVTFANVIDPFVDRVYGPNFDPDNEEDRRFIDAVATLDDAAIDLSPSPRRNSSARFETAPWYAGIRGTAAGADRAPPRRSLLDDPPAAAAQAVAMSDRTCAAARTRLGGATTTCGRGRSSGWAWR